MEEMGLICDCFGWRTERRIQGQRLRCGPQRLEVPITRISRRKKTWVSNDTESQNVSLPDLVLPSGQVVAPGKQLSKETNPKGDMLPRRRHTCSGLQWSRTYSGSSLCLSVYMAFSAFLCPYAGRYKEFPYSVTSTLEICFTIVEQKSEINVCQDCVP